MNDLPVVEAIRRKAASLPLPDGWRIVRAPGRVNLIGEHTDYNGLPVMPMALDRAIYAAFRALDEPVVRLVNTDESLPPREFGISQFIEPYAPGDWGNYAKAAVQALASHHSSAQRGFEAVVGGDIPGGAGLSSSSAMVVAMALAFAEVNDLDVRRATLADLLAEGERYVGTQGGGMDQTICLLAEAGTALQIEFLPTRIFPHKLPAGTSVVIANSLVKAEKSADARANYNLRPAECRMACAVLSKALQRSIANLAEFLELFGPDGALSNAFEILGLAPWPAQRLAREMDMSIDILQRTLLTQRDGSALEEPPSGFALGRRVRHVLTEAVRVREAAQALDSSDAAEAGRLMGQSHVSCRDDYQISCPELDALVDILEESGALGARLTGAGFGGCAVALARSSQLSEILKQVSERYYSGWLKRNRPDIFERLPARVEQYLFASASVDGATISAM
ncbi:MAG: galactokinase [Armatimonadetes bacterium]|nr:galactokinase [Armatimonadota bacterium]